MLSIVETVVGAFCLVAAGILLTDAATLVSALRYYCKHRGGA